MIFAMSLIYLKDKIMILTCDINKLAESILKDYKRKEFLERYDPEKFKWGIDVQTYEKWTSEQQGKIFRDFTIAGKLLNTSANAIYSIVKTSKPTRHLFEKVEYVGTKERGKSVTTEKGLSQWTKQDCVEGIPIIIAYLEMVINTVYQEKVIVNWSSKENVDLPDFEFTGIPFKIE